MNFIQLKNSYYSHTPCYPGSPRWSTPIYSDIVLHLPVLEFYAGKCDSVVEFGVRDGFSTLAFLSKCRKKVTSYDIEETKIVDILCKMDLPCSWHFILGDTGDPDLEIGETDFLFIDTLHTYNHVRKELRQAKYVKKYIGFHDTYTCGLKDLSGPNPNEVGILPAISEFRRDNPEWGIIYETEANNGLIILERE